MSIDADGAPRAYHPPVSAAPAARHPASTTSETRAAPETGSASSPTPTATLHPAQARPAPGFYVSATSLVQRGTFAAA